MSPYAHKTLHLPVRWTQEGIKSVAMIEHSNSLILSDTKAQYKVEID